MSLLLGSESAERDTKVSGAKVQKLPYPLDGPSISKADNTKTEELLRYRTGL